LVFAGFENGQLYLKPNHAYWHQIQGQLHITGFDIADPVVWTTRDIQVVRIQKCKNWMSNISRLIDFYFTSFIPAINNGS
jgi:hypothetical protein